MTDWDTSSIAGMERTAKSEDANDCSIKIRGEWLEVQWDGVFFTYKWGKNFITREAAIKVHATK